MKFGITIGKEVFVFALVYRAGINHDNTPPKYKGDTHIS
jgi:hypothetical protein